MIAVIDQFIGLLQISNRYYFTYSVFSVIFWFTQSSQTRLTEVIRAGEKREDRKVNAMLN
jgi:hypothetical protein